MSRQQERQEDYQERIQNQDKKDREYCNCCRETIEKCKNNSRRFIRA